MEEYRIVRCSITGLYNQVPIDAEEVKPVYVPEEAKPPEERSAKCQLPHKKSLPKHSASSER